MKPVASFKAYVQENVDFPLHLVGDALKPAQASSFSEVGREEGMIVSHEGQRLAVFRDARGALHAVSAVCTHLGCQVAFNTAATSWDCPCHGSRFSVDGEVLAGPATAALARHHLDSEKTES